MRTGSVLVATLVAALLTLAAPGRARAEGSGSDGTGIGVGVESLLGSETIPVITPGNNLTLGITGPAVTFQTTRFHVTGILTFSDFDPVTTTGAAGRFFFALHKTQASDFNIGGGVGFLHVSISGPDTSDTILDLEIGAQLRAFLAPAFAIEASTGLGFLSDGDNVTTMSGQIVTSVGMTYFFF